MDFWQRERGRLQKLSTKGLFDVDTIGQTPKEVTLPHQWGGVPFLVCGCVSSHFPAAMSAGSGGGLPHNYAQDAADERQRIIYRTMVSRSHPTPTPFCPLVVCVVFVVFRVWRGDGWLALSRF